MSCHITEHVTSQIVSQIMLHTVILHAWQDAWQDAIMVGWAAILKAEQLQQGSPVYAILGLSFNHAKRCGVSFFQSKRSTFRL